MCAETLFRVLIESKNTRDSGKPSSPVWGTRTTRYPMVLDVGQHKVSLVITSVWNLFLIVKRCSYIHIRF